jgi:hypothetical protein
VSKGQALRDAHKLIEARDQFRVCAAPACPAVMQSDCTNWISDADNAVPTIVVSAKDASGNDIFDVSVSVDGMPLVAKLDGAAIPVDPGPHTFRFQWADGTASERRVLVAEGQKDMSVFATFAAPSTPVSPPLAIALGGIGPTSAVATPSETNPRGRLRMAGFVVGEVGLLGVAVGSVLGVLAIANASHAKSECQAPTQSGPSACSGNTSSEAESDMQTARNLGNASTAVLLGGVALLGTGVTMVLLGGSKKEESALRIAPTLLAHGGALGVEGAW